MDEENARLAEAILRNDAAGVDAALAEGARIDARVALAAHRLSPPKPALAWTLYLGVDRAIPMAERLLAAGADIDRTDGYGCTALHLAVMNHGADTRFVELLLRRGANPNTGVNSTPLERACETGIGVATLLLQAGATITPVALSKARNEPALLALLEEWPIRNASVEDRDKQLMLVAQQGDLAQVRQLLHEGARATARDTAGCSAIDHARAKGHATVAQVLEVAAVVGLADAPLFVATLEGTDEEIRAAAAAGRDLEARNAERLTPLMLAARYGRRAAMACLLSLGAQIDKRNGGRTALVYAIEANDLEATRLLLDRGAIFDLRVEARNPVLDAACRVSDSEIVKQLLVRGIDIASHPEQWSSVDSSARMLKNARAGKLPIAGPPPHSASATCDLCGGLPSSMGWCQPINGDYQGEPLPEVTEQFETFHRERLRKCPGCGSYFEYEHDRDGSVCDGWDSESLVRITLQKALELLQDATPDPRIAREIANVQARCTIAGASDSK